MEKKTGIKLIGLVILGIIVHLLLNILDKELDWVSYLYGIIATLWLWFADETF